MRWHSGIRRVELQFLALNAGGAGLMLGALNVLGNYLNIRTFNRAGVVLMLAASALTAWAILFHRVFNAQEVFLRLSRRLSFAVLLSGGIYGMWRATSSLLAEPFGLLVSIGLCSPVAVWLDRRSRVWFDANAERKLAEMRQAAIELSRTEFQAEKLVRGFESLLAASFQTPSAGLLFDTGDNYESTSRILLDKRRPAFEQLCDLGWATPESLLRRRATSGIDDLREFLGRNQVGLMVAVPRRSPAPSLLVVLLPRINDWPFTYPEVERMQNLAVLMDNLLARARVASQAALQVRMEHLGMMSRGLAHDLKNLVTPVSSFLVHTDGHFPADSIEAEVHAAARRSMRVMTQYLREALFFSERLEPHFEDVFINTLCTTAQEIVSARAERRQVQLAAVVDVAQPIAADGALLQRLIANLLSNAIDASSPGQTVSLNASFRRTRGIRLQVSDDGCGISMDNLTRIFDPYFTTKEFGDEHRGFGLGLTICQKIVLLHQGTISVKSEVNIGTTITVELPTTQTTPSTPVAPEPLALSLEFQR